MKERLKTLVTISFRDIFPESERKELSELLNGIPSCTILSIISHFMAQIHAKEDDFELQKEIIIRWVNQQDLQTRNNLLKKFDEFIERNNSNITFFSNITSLYFIQELFKNFNSIQDRGLTADEELRLIKAYLIVSERWSDKEIEHLKQRPQNDSELIAYILPFQMTHNEIQSYKDFRPQLLKAIYFFRFLEVDKDLGKYLPDFLSQYGLTSWNEYLKLTLIPYVLSLTGTLSSVLIFDKTNKVETDYWDTFCIDLANYESKLDFLELRETPVYKLKEFSYLFYNYNFIIDKLFQSLQFVFSKVLVSKEVVKDFGDFKSKYYSEKFSENFMLYKAIEHSIANQKRIISFNGEQLAAQLGEKGPDYYLRVDNNIIIIEFKDVLMGASPKVSYDFKSISHEISKKLVKNEGGKAKGVGQLAKFINEIPEGGYPFDPITAETLNVYPMLIVTDSSFTLFGINEILEKEFTALITIDTYKNIKHLALSKIDTILLFQDDFNENRINFFDILIGYDRDYHQENSIYKFSNMDNYFYDYINHNRIPLKNMPSILKEFITNELVK